jgi:hypothetical protein
VELLKQKAKKAESKTSETSGPAKSYDPEVPAGEKAVERTDHDGIADGEDNSKVDEPRGSPPPQEAGSSAQQQPSLTHQSKMRSSSFRKSISGPLSPISAPKVAFNPEEDTALEIYRKQAARIEDLEKENKRLAKETADGEKRWRKAEEELEVLREAEPDNLRFRGDANVPSGEVGEVEKLVSCYVTLLSEP